MITPRLNLNGTSAASLMEGYNVALQALRVAREKLHEAGPHGRDYQTLPEGDYKLAVTEHTARVQSINRIIDELIELAENVYGQHTSRMAIIIGGKVSSSLSRVVK